MIEPLLACANIADAGKELVKIVRASIRVLEAFIINEKALLQILPQRCIRPAAELCTARGTDAKADSKNDVVILSRTVDKFLTRE